MTTHTYTSSTHSARIREFCLQRNISIITHFTRVENLVNILSNGLLSREELKRRNLPVVVNDQERYDRQTGAICLSVSFPNYQMFFRYRSNSTSKWVVLALDARILWEADCAFCYTNAASSIIRDIPIAHRKRPESLEQMFSDYSDGTSKIARDGLFLPKNYSTNPQAEILAFKPITLNYIQNIYVEKRSEAAEIIRNLPAKYASLPISVNSFFFRPRDDYEIWKSTRSARAYSPALIDKDIPF